MAVNPTRLARLIPRTLDLENPIMEMAAAGVDTAVNGKYVIERRLGSGGMAEVFLARTVGAEGFSRQVAIKRVLDGLSRNPRFARCFVSEAQLTSQLQHPNIVSVLDFDRDREGRLFLVMELVDGTDLDGLIATGALPFPVILYLATEILRGLDYAHDLPITGGQVRGIIHRDISPHNVLLSWTGAVKISDFGIAKARAASNASASLIIKGKPAYMSPEQANGQPLDGRSDLFSVGVMLFEMLCLQHLFAAETTAATIARLLHAAIPAPREVRPEVPEDLSRVVMSLLARDRQQRCPDAEAAIAALVACADYPRDGREALVTTLSQRFAGRAPVRGRGSAPSPERWAEARRRVVALPPEARTLTPSSGLRVSGRRRWPWALLATCVAASTTVAAILVTGGSPRPPTAPAIEVPADPAAITSTPTSAPPVPAVAAPTPSPRSGSAGPAAAPAAQPLPTSSLLGSGSRARSTPANTPSASGTSNGQDRPPSPRAQARPADPAAPSTEGIQEIHLGGT